MLKLEVFDPPMCCATGICGTNVDPTLVIFASDLEWLKKQGVDVVRHGLSFEPAEFVKNDVVKDTLSSDGNGCLPIILLDKEFISKGCYPSRAKLAEICKIEYSEQEAPPVHREENCCCGIDCECDNAHPAKSCSPEINCDCTNAAVEDNCFCGPECDCHKSYFSNNAKKIIFVIVLLIIFGIIAVKLSSKAGAAEVKKSTQTIASEKFGETLESLSQISASQGVAFIYIPTKNNEKISGSIKKAMLSAQSALKAKNITASLYTMNPKSLEYPQIASKTTPPAILTVYKGKSKNYVSGKINQTRLLQSYMTATQEGACGAGCPCHRRK